MLPSALGQTLCNVTSASLKEKIKKNKKQLRIARLFNLQQYTDSKKAAAHKWHRSPRRRGFDSIATYHVLTPCVISTYLHYSSMLIVYDLPPQSTVLSRRLAFKYKTNNSLKEFKIIGIFFYVTTCGEMSCLAEFCALRGLFELDKQSLWKVLTLQNSKVTERQHTKPNCRI